MCLFDLIMYANVRRNFTAQDVGLPCDAKNKIYNLDSILSFWNKKRSIPSPFIKEIRDNALDNHILSIEYLSKSENINREIAPIGVYSYDGFWYMPAFDMLHNEIRIFRLDRILTLKSTHKK